MTEIICLALLVAMIVLFIRVIVDWVVLAGWRPPHSGPIRAALDVTVDVTEPPLRLLRPDAAFWPTSSPVRRPGRVR